ncbi:MAG: hypothetical protein VR64_06085 [Desulfatitalea sp. BRH_c12]|nr:MAG: hypothetical protein VR64_06085 [Desulfatitalea sp. BRH_c12]
MQYPFLRAGLVTFMVVGLFIAGPAQAKKPDWEDSGKNNRQHFDGHEHQKERRDDPKHRVYDNRKGQRDDHDRSKKKHKSAGHGNNYDKRRVYFNEHHHVTINNYYGERFRSGKCPPGLVKKNRECVPPRARGWSYGRPLPREVIFYDLPPHIVTHLGPPPSGHRFVRVAQDILMIAVGTGMVVDGIENIGMEFER